MFVK